VKRPFIPDLLKLSLALALAAGLALPAAAKPAAPRDRLTLKGGEIVEGRIDEHNDAGYTVMMGNRKRYVDARTVEKVEWDTDSRKMPWAAQLGGGLARPLSPQGFKEFVDPGLSLGAAVGFALHPRWSLQGDFGYSLLPLNRDKATQGLGPVSSFEGGDTYVGTGLLAVRVYPFTRLHAFAPYLMAGAGFYNISTRFMEIVTSANQVVQSPGNSESGIALAAAGGMEIFFSKNFGFFAEARWLDALDASPAGAVTLLPLRAGISLRYGVASAGTTADY
jgi:hypothetical protein